MIKYEKNISNVLFKQGVQYLLSIQEGKSQSFCYKSKKEFCYTAFTQFVRICQKNKIVYGVRVGREKKLTLTKKGKELYNLFAQIKDQIHG